MPHSPGIVSCLCLAKECAFVWAFPGSEKGQLSSFWKGGIEMSWCWRRIHVFMLKKETPFPRRTHLLVLKKDNCHGFQKHDRCPGFEEGHVSWFWKRTDVLVLKKDMCPGFEEGHMSWPWRRTNLLILKKSNLLVLKKDTEVWRKCTNKQALPQTFDGSSANAWWKFDWSLTNMWRSWLLIWKY